MYTPTQKKLVLLFFILVMLSGVGWLITTILGFTTYIFAPSALIVIGFLLAIATASEPTIGG